MGWARLDDGWHDHPKVVEAGLDGAGLFAMCLTWAHRARRTSPTPGVVPPSVVARFAGAKASRLSRKLREVGLFDERVAAGWPIHDFDDYLPKYDSEQARAAGSAGGLAKSRNGKPRGGAKPLLESPSEPLDEPLTEPPSEPEDEPPSEPLSGAVATRADAPASARRNPVPEPEVPRGETSGGGVAQVTRASRDAPPERCPRHLDAPAPGPCGPCGGARRAREQWDREEQQRRRDAGLVVGGHTCPDHPDQPAGTCGRCTVEAVPMPVDEIRAALGRRRAS